LAERHVQETLRLTRAGAFAVLTAALEKAAALGVPMSIGVADAGGHLLAFARTDHGKPHTIEIAIAKARAAASLRLPTGKHGSSGNPLPDFGALALTLAADGAYTGLGGGLPIMAGAHCVGGIGVSGGTADQDVEVCEAGLAALRM
jgi:glc operon protein GlcG